MSKKLFNRNIGKLFKPSVRRNYSPASAYLNKKDVRDFSFEKFKDTNLFSSSSFRYGDKEGIVSTQELNIDYSQFSNHTFFHSAVAKVNEAFDLIINKYPFDGSNKEIEIFEDSLTGFEKYVFNQFPKNKGYLNFSGSAGTSGGTFLSVKDAAGVEISSLSNALSKNASQRLDPLRSDFMFQSHIKIPEQVNDNQIILQKKSSVANNITLALSQSSSVSSASIVFGIQSGSNFNYASMEVEKGSFFHLSAMYHGSVDQRLKLIKFKDDVKTVVSSSMQVEFSNLSYSGNDFLIGSGSSARINNDSLVFIPKETFSGSMDDLRYFKKVENDDIIKRDLSRSVSGKENLVLYFKFNEPTGSYAGNNIALDSSGNSFNTLINNFTVQSRLTGSDNPMSSELLSQCPVLFPSFHEIESLNSDLITSGSEYDEYNPNLITKLIPPHYFQEGNEFENFSDVLGKLSTQFENYSNIRSNPDGLSSVQLLVSFLLIWSKFFDEIKLFIDNFSLFFVDYEDLDTVADKLLPSLGRNLGIDVPMLFKSATNPDQLFNGIDLKNEAAVAVKTLHQIQNLIWRRLLSDSSNITLSKGTLDSIRSVFRSSGIEPENIFDFREYGGAKIKSLEASRKEKKDVVWLMDFSGSAGHKNEAVNAQGISSTSPILKSAFLSGSRLEVGLPEVDGTFVNKTIYYPHGISDDPSDGLLTSGSFNFNGTYLFSAKNSHDNLQSLVRLHVTGTAAPSDVEACALNLVNNKQLKKLNLYFKADATPITTTPVKHMFLTGLDIVDGDLWGINFGRKGTHETLGLKDEYYLRASKFIAGNIVENFYTSSYFDRSLSSVFSNITTNNTSGSFIVIGSQSLAAPSSTSEFINHGSDEQKTTYFSGRVGFVNFWSKSASEGEFEAYAKNPNSVGSENPLINYNFNKTLTGSFERLRLTTSGKQSTTGSDSSGDIRLFDNSQNELHLEGSGFEVSKQVVNPSYVIYEELDSNFDINTSKTKVRIRGLQNTDLLKYHEFASISPNNETVLSEEVVDDNRFSIDMSVMRGLNENILTIFSDFKSMDNAIGQPNLMFAEFYPDLVNYRKMYFENVLEKLDLGKYRELFKWIDAAYSDLVLSLVPRTTNFLGINFVYESHVLERHKLRYLYDEIYLRSLDRNCSGGHSLPAENDNPVDNEVIIGNEGPVIYF